MLLFKESKSVNRTILFLKGVYAVSFSLFVSIKETLETTYMVIKCLHLKYYSTLALDKGEQLAAIEKLANNVTSTSLPNSTCSLS